MKQEVKEEEIKDEEVKDEPESDDEDESGIKAFFDDWKFRYLWKIRSRGRSFLKCRSFKNCIFSPISIAGFTFFFLQI